MRIKKLKELLQFFESSGLDELEVQHFFIRVKMVKKRFNEVKELRTEGGETESVTLSMSDEAEKDRELSKDHLYPIKSPIVGTFYRAPAPNADPFVEIGDYVESGQVLCIIEAMKVMNEIEADRSGKIVEILVNDGEPVEYGQVLFYLEPDRSS